MDKIFTPPHNLRSFGKLFDIFRERLLFHQIQTLFLTFLIALTYGCMPEEFEPPNLTDSEVIKAKKWFESQDLKNYSGLHSQNKRNSN